MAYDLMGYLRRTHRRITRDMVAKTLGVSIDTVKRRINDGFTADEVIETCTALGLSPVAVLVELGAIGPDDVAKTAGSLALQQLSERELAAELFARIDARERPSEGPANSSAAPAVAAHAPALGTTSTSARQPPDLDAWSLAADDPSGYTIEQEQEETELEP